MRLVRLLMFCLCLPFLSFLSGCGTTAAGTFTVTADSSVTLAQGESRSFTVTAASSDNFKGSVFISPRGLPTGVTSAPGSLTVTAGTPSTFTLTASSTAPAGTTNVSLIGTSGDLSASAKVAVTVTAVAPPSGNQQDFTLAVAPASATLGAGASTQVTLSSTAVNGFSGPISVAINGLPAGVTASPATISLQPGTPQTVTLTASATAAGTPSPATVSFVGTSGSLTHTATLALNVTATTPGNNPDFTLTAAPGTVALTAGSSSQVTLNSSALNGFSGGVSIAISGLPTGVTASPSTATLQPGTPLTITLTASLTAPATTSPAVVRFVGTSGSLSHTATVSVTVSAAPDFTLSATPATLNVTQGAQSAPLQISAAAQNSFTGSITFTVSGLPSGVTATPATGTLQSGNPASIVFNASSTATLGTATITITATSGTLTHTATVALTVVAPNVTLTLSPSTVTVPINSFALVTVTANGPGTVQVSLSGLPAGVTAHPSTVSVSPTTSETIVLTADTTAQPGTSTVNFTGSYQSLNGTAPLTLQVITAPVHPLDVPTWHYNAQRTGLNSVETVLAPANIGSGNFGKLSSWTVDAAVDAQPLFASGVTIGSKSHNVLYVATENDTMYAIDADSGTVLWQTSVLGANETASDDHGCNEVSPKIGITATPVLDRNYPSHGAIFFVALTKDSGGNYHQRLHGLDITTGAEIAAGPVEISATYPGAGPAGDGTTYTFDPGKYVERAALLLSNSTIYLSWAAPCQQGTLNYSSWVMSYDEPTLSQQSVLNLTPNGNGGGIWMSGAGPAADTAGNVYLATSKGTFDTTLTTDGFLRPVNGDYGNAFLKLETTNSALTAFDYFEPINGVPGSTGYADQGSGGVLVVPDIPLQGSTIPIIQQLLVGAGKDGNIYVMDRSSDVLGEYFGGGGFDLNYTTVTGATPSGVTSSPAYFNGFLYYAGISDTVKSYDIFTDAQTGVLNGPSDGSAVPLGAAGATPVITANGTNAAILWALDTLATGGPVLHAYDATHLTTELYNSTQALTGGAPRDAVHATGKFTVPVVVNGHVYIATQNGVDVFGLLP